LGLEAFWKIEYLLVLGLEIIFKIKNLSISRPGQLFLTNGFGFKEYFQKLKHVGSRARSISFTNGFGFFKYFHKLKTCWLCGWVKLF
jgi:hypothetical protein